MSTSTSSVQVNRGVNVYVAVKVNAGDNVDVKVNVIQPKRPFRKADEPRKQPRVTISASELCYDCGLLISSRSFFFRGD